MNIVYHRDDGWLLVDKIDQIEHFYVSQASSLPFEDTLFQDLDTFIMPLDSGCGFWVGGSHSRSRANAAPYYLNKYVPSYPRQISARQLVLARYLNTSYVKMGNFRIGLLCGTPQCVAVAHAIPYSYVVRTKLGSPIAQPPETEVSPELQAELQAHAEAMRASLDPTGKPKEHKVLTADDILKKAFGDKPKTIEEKLKDWTAPAPKTVEPEDTNLDTIDWVRKLTQG